MGIQRFSAFIAEEAPSKDYVGKKDDDDQVKGYKPRSKGEQDFANMHNVTKHDYPVDVDKQFTGNVEATVQPNNGEKVTKQGSSDVNQPNGGGDSARPADKKQGDSMTTVKEEVEGEDLDLTEGKVMDALEKIVKTKGAGTVKFANGKSLKVDMTTANAMLNMQKKLNDKNKEKMADKIEQSPEMFMKLMDVAFGGK